MPRDTNSREQGEKFSRGCKNAAVVAALFCSAGILTIIQLINNVVVEYYSPGFMSDSVADARSRGVFISQPTLESKATRWRKSEYSIREAWVEQATRVKYDFIFFRRVIPTGHRLVFNIERIGKPPGEDFMYFGSKGELLVCNDSIWISESNTELWFAEFSSPIPSLVKCVVKQQK